MEAYKIRKVNNKNVNVFNRGHNLNKHNDSLTKSEKLMNGVGLWTSFYRNNPHRFVKDYLNINLKLFQKILIYMMMNYNYFMYIASRGQGKTFLTSICICARCILFPETKVVLASGNVKQAIEVLSKIEDLRKNSPFLDREIEGISTNVNNANCNFHNGSWVRVVASNDGARCGRANLLIENCLGI